MFLYCVSIVFILYISQGHALNCYTCSSTESDYVDACVSSPTKDYIRSCDRKYCNIIRIEYLDPIGRIASMSRSCSDTFLDGITEDSTYRTYEVSCKEDKCNTGNGKTSSDSSTSALGDKSTIYVPGSGSSSSHSLLPFIPIFVLVIMSILWR